MERPDFSDIRSGEEFNQWYWLKSEMVDICREAGLPINGRKFDLRDRIMYALDNDGALLPAAKQPRKTSRFNWARSELALDTVITDNVSFGPNFRKFMTTQIGSRFVCHSDFMDWVKARVGHTLGEAVVQWELLEKRKEDPTFQRDIAKQNMLAQYVRDFLADHPDKVFKDALACWKRKRRLPMKGGYVRYAASDLSL
ncbi:MAG: DUF6434 domain-containing protein [Bacteroidota bacterium]